MEKNDFMCDLTVEQFVRGMAWHDAAKPMALGTSRHPAPGAWLLSRAGYEPEAWGALLHGGEAPNLGEGQHLSVLLVLGNPLDCLAASFYSLLSCRFNTNALKSEKPLFHSWQNPFSRLPMCSPELGKRLIVAEYRKNGDKDLRYNRREQLDISLGKAIIERLPESWGIGSLDDLESAAKDYSPLPPSDTAEKYPDVVKMLLGFMSHYPERTYPPANDTSLTEHCRLAGALAFVVYRNLAQRDSKWQKATVVKSGKVYLLDPDGEKIDEERIACENLVDASLVRIAFDGHRRLFEEAVRVDDLLGARMLTNRFLDLFEEKFAEVLGVPGLIWDMEGEDRRCWLTLQRSQFDLLYLLPTQPTPDSKMTIAEAIQCAYEQALEAISEQLTKELSDDFRKAEGRLAFDEKACAALQAQLGLLHYRVRILPLDVNSPSGEISFGDFVRAYGEALIEKLHTALAEAFVPEGEGAPLRCADWQAIPAGGTCQVCGTHPVFDPFVTLMEDDDWRPHLQKVVHYFRGAPERLCISCMARRILAHGLVAAETPALERMVKWTEGPSPRMLVTRPTDELKAEGLPSLPPALVSAEFADKDDFVDLGAAYGRCRRYGNDVRYDQPPRLFPTIGYAADANSNVVMLSLQPTSALYASYAYDEALALSNSVEMSARLTEIERGEGCIPEDDVGFWLASFVSPYIWAKNQDKTLGANVAEVRPHMARIMQRIQHIKQFYRALKETLECGWKLTDEEPKKSNVKDAAGTDSNSERFRASMPPLRVLPLDVAFPTLRLLLPADMLDQALRTLDFVVTESLFSATYTEDPQRRAKLHALLESLVPDLLHGTVVLFKQKFPLYLALEAERDLFGQLAAGDRPQRLNPGRPSQANWYGFRLGFSDLRGTLTEAGPLHAAISYQQLGPVLALAGRVDRRTVVQFGETRGSGAGEAWKDLARAEALVRGNRIGLSQADVEALQEDQVFSAISFIKRATRR